MWTTLCCKRYKYTSEYLCRWFSLNMTNMLLVQSTDLFGFEHLTSNAHPELLIYNFTVEMFLRIQIGTHRFGNPLIVSMTCLEPTIPISKPHEATDGKPLSNNKRERERNMSERRIFAECLPSCESVLFASFASNGCNKKCLKCTTWND